MSLFSKCKLSFYKLSPLPLLQVGSVQGNDQSLQGENKPTHWVEVSAKRIIKQRAEE